MTCDNVFFGSIAIWPQGGSQQFFWLGGVPFEIRISHRRQASISLKLQHLFDAYAKFFFR